MTVRSTGRRPAGEAAFVVVTGFSGAGKSHAIRALEDLGYFCVDNLPIALLPTFAGLSLNASDSARRAAVVIDVRERDAFGSFPSAYKRLKRLGGARVRLLFLDATDTVLMRRFSETRRPHPLAGSSSVAEGLAEERRLLEPVRKLADQVIDTTAMTVHELRRRIRELTDVAARPTPLVVTLLSFGYRRGLPAEADLAFDVRFLPNPHFVPSLRRWTGRNQRVARYVLRTRPAIQFIKLTTDLLRFLIPQYIAEGKTYLTIAIGCTGGKHRSVALAEALAKRLRGMKGIDLHVRHRDERDE